MNKRQRLLLRWSVVTTVLLLVVAVIVAIISRPSYEAVPAVGLGVDGVTNVLDRTVGERAAPIRFEDVTEDMGIDFRHFQVQRESLLPEDMGSGVAVGDFDNDGWDDLYFVDFCGSILPDAPPAPTDCGGRLYRNLSGERFEDVTDRAGVRFVGFGMGAAWGDYDNDGDQDLYVTAFGDNVLYQNLGDGTFREVTKEAGVNDELFSAGCSWADYDRDGDLDLYVANYVDFVFRPQDRFAKKQQYSTEQPYTLNPSAYEPLPNALFRNNGDGTFTDVAADAGVADPGGRSLSASWIDFDNDGLPDLYVANDVSNNGVFRNRGDGTFEDVGAGSLAADYRGAMGIAVADVDNDLDLDLLVTHWIAQENALYRNMLYDEMLAEDQHGRLWFLDSADELGLGQSSLDMVGWACGFCDFDNDGLLDLWVVNGSTLEDVEDHRKLVPQKPFLYWNRGQEGFVDVAAASPALRQPFVGRGGAQFDFDHDGLVDWVFVRHGGRACLLRNISEPTGHWLRVTLRQGGGNTSAIGARVLVTVGEKTQMAEVGTASSYLSRHELTVHFGLGASETVDELRIVWPDGHEERHTAVAADQRVTYTHDSTYPVDR